MTILLAFMLSSLASAQGTPAPKEDKPAVAAPAAEAPKSTEAIPEKKTETPVAEPKKAIPGTLIDTPPAVPSAAVEPAKAAPPKAPACACPPEEKPLAGCVQSLKTVSDAYAAAFKTFQAWAKEASGRVQELQTQSDEMHSKISNNEATITKLKLEGGKDAKSRLKELNKENKQLWKDLAGIDRQKKALCGQIARETAVKVREINEGVRQSLTQAQAEMK